jgi:hypothetical protein
MKGQCSGGTMVTTNMVLSIRATKEPMKYWPIRVCMAMPKPWPKAGPRKSMTDRTKTMRGGRWRKDVMKYSVHNGRCRGCERGCRAQRRGCGLLCALGRRRKEERNLGGEAGFMYCEEGAHDQR